LGEAAAKGLNPLFKTLARTQNIAFGLIIFYKVIIEMMAHSSQKYGSDLLFSCENTKTSTPSIPNYRLLCI
jgi:hypothetical protein